jgi:prepilin-type N-terminal cleavage/methylation domain-containing protein
MIIKKAFTLIELLIVISIIGILSAITLQFNRSKVKDMEAMNDREQRLSRHRKENNIITNSNFINGQKISTGIQFIYSG